MIVIKVFENSQETQRFEIPTGIERVITIGRYSDGGKTTDIVLPNNNLVSRNHGYLSIDSKGRITYTDASKLGSLVNSTSISNDTLYLSFPVNEIAFQISGNFKIVVEIIKDLARDNIGQPSSKIGKTRPQGSNLNLGKLIRLNVKTAFETSKTVSFGRSQENDFTLNSLNISRKHAIIETKGGNLVLTDLGSKNGTFLNGRKVVRAKIRVRDFIQIGPYQIALVEQDEALSKQQDEQFSLVCNGVFKNVQHKGKPLTILQKSSFKIKRNALVAIMGPSGSGKSTLMDAINGLNPATGGEVYINGQNLYNNYSSLKRQFGYVPQDDIVHLGLTVYQTMWYAAKLRLESDITDIEIDKRIAKILDDLNISDEKDKKISSLSGGARKRVSIASELLTEPSILFLDEPTSPLDPAMVREFLSILRTLSQQGTTIIMITHKPEDLEHMDEVIYISNGGYLTYHGPVGASMYNYFGKTGIVDIYELLNDTELSKKYYNKSSHENEGIDKLKNQDFKLTLPRENNSFSQFYWLSKRYLTLKLSDRRATIISLLQAPFIAILMLFIFDVIQVRSLYFLAICAIWCGVNNAAREISEEVSIYKRERMYNLRILSYICSKVSIQSILIIIQVLIFLIILQLRYHLADDLLHFLSLVAFMFSLTLAATFMGLCVSAIMKNAEKVTSILPLVILPQILLAGVISPIGLNGNLPVDLMSQLTLGRWGTQGFCNIQDSVVAQVPIVTTKGLSLKYDVKMSEDTVHFTDILKYPDRLSIGTEYYDKIEDENYRQFNLLHNYLALFLLSIIFIFGIVYGLLKMDPL